MMIDATLDLHEEYSAHLEAQKEGTHGMLRWCAERACGNWYQTIVKMINRMTGPDTAERLKMTTPSPFRVFQPDDPVLEEESKLAKQYVKLVMTLAANRAWSQVHFGLVFPYCLARIMSPNQDDKRRAQVLLRSLTDAILKLEDRTKVAHQKSPLHRLLCDLGTTEWVVTREIFVQGIRVDWCYNDVELRKMAFSLSAGPSTTKYCLENVISTVKDCGQRVKKNTRNMSMHTKWMYAGTSHYAPAGGVEQLQVDRDDLLKTCLQKGVEQKFVQGKWLAEAKASFKDVFPTPEDILHETRKAGYLANKRAASAAAFVLHDSRNDFSNVSKAWTGLV